MRDLLVKADWFEGLEKAPIEVKKEIFYRIIETGCFENKIDTSQDDWGIGHAWNMISGNIQRMKEAKERQQEYGKTHGRKAYAQEEVIYNYLKEHPNVKASVVGTELNLPKADAKKGPYAYIYNMSVWRNRATIDPSLSYKEWRDKLEKKGKNSEKGIPIQEENSENKNSEQESENRNVPAYELF